MSVRSRFLVARCCCRRRYNKPQIWRIAVTPVRNLNIELTGVGFYEPFTEATRIGTESFVSSLPTSDQGNLVVQRIALTQRWSINYEGTAVEVTHDFEVDGPLIDLVIDLSGDTCNARRVVISLAWQEDYTLPSNFRTDGFGYYHRAHQHNDLICLSFDHGRVVNNSNALLTQRRELAVNYSLIPSAVITSFFSSEVSSWQVANPDRPINAGGGVKIVHEAQGVRTDLPAVHSFRWVSSSPALAIGFIGVDSYNSFINLSGNAFIYDPDDTPRIVEWDLTTSTLGSHDLQTTRAINSWRWYSSQPPFLPGGNIDLIVAPADIANFRALIAAIEGLRELAPGTSNAFIRWIDFQLYIPSRPLMTENITELVAYLNIDAGGYFYGGFNLDGSVTMTVDGFGNFSGTISLTLVCSRSLASSGGFGNRYIEANFAQINVSGNILKTGIPAECF